MYFRNRLGYDVSCLAAKEKEWDRAKGEVGIVSRERLEGWIIGSTRFYGPNMVSYEFVTGNILMPVIEAYLLPSTLNHLNILRKPSADS